MANELVVPPGNILGPFAPQKAPVARDGGFFYTQSAPQGFMYALDGAVVIPINAEGNPMSPVEASTGVPLPILASTRGSKQNRHHAHFYERHYTNGTMDIRAVRYSRLQRVAVQAHTRYHQEYDGTLLPDSENEAYRLTILNCAGYIPAYGVHIKGRDVTIRRMTNAERKILRKPSMFTMERAQQRQSVIGQFLMYYALDQKFEDSKMHHIEEFLSITPEQMRTDEVLRQKKLRLGMKLANRAIGQAVDPLQADFSRARQKRALRANAPDSPWIVAKNLIKGREPDYFDTLEQRLVEQFGAAA